MTNYALCQSFRSSACKPIRPFAEDLPAWRWASAASPGARPTSRAATDVLAAVLANSRGAGDKRYRDRTDDGEMTRAIYYELSQSFVPARQCELHVHGCEKAGNGAAAKVNSCKA